MKELETIADNPTLIILITTGIYLLRVFVAWVVYKKRYKKRARDRHKIF